jgi:hypothetical protein
VVVFVKLSSNTNKTGNLNVVLVSVYQNRKGGLFVLNEMTKIGEKESKQERNRKKKKKKKTSASDINADFYYRISCGNICRI